MPVSEPWWRHSKIVRRCLPKGPGLPFSWPLSCERIDIPSTKWCKYNIYIIWNIMEYLSSWNRGYDIYIYCRYIHIYIIYTYIIAWFVDISCTHVSTSRLSTNPLWSSFWGFQTRALQQRSWLFGAIKGLVNSKQLICFPSPQLSQLFWPIPKHLVIMNYDRIL